MKTTVRSLVSATFTIAIANLTMPCQTEANADPTVSQTETKIASLLKAIEKGRQEQDNGDYQGKALGKANDDMLAYMSEACKNPALLTQKLKKASDAGLSMANSEDNKLRFYSWDTDTGGTMHFFYAMAQYQPETGKQSKSLTIYPSGRKKVSDGDIESGYTFGSVAQMRTSDRKTIYLPIGYGVYSGMDSGVVIQAYEIENNILKKVPIFKTKTQSLDEISCNFHGGEQDDIDVDEKSKKLSIPLLKGEGEPTGKCLVYIFDGHQFVYKDIERSEKRKPNPR